MNDTGQENAAGSVTGSSSSGLSEEQGRVAADNALGKSKTLNSDWVPHIVYTEPEIAAVGCTALEAHHKGFRAVEGRCDALQLGHSLIQDESAGWFKVVADKPSKRVIGAQIVSPSASEIIPLVLLAMRKGLTVGALAALPCGLSTESRGIREAAKACEKALQGELKGP